MNAQCAIPSTTNLHQSVFFCFESLQKCYITGIAFISLETRFAKIKISANRTHPSFALTLCALRDVIRKASIRVLIPVAISTTESAVPCQIMGRTFLIKKHFQIKETDSKTSEYGGGLEEFHFFAFMCIALLRYFIWG